MIDLLNQVLLKASDLGTSLKFIVVTFGIIFYFYVECYISQILMDHSIIIRFSM